VCECVCVCEREREKEREREIARVRERDRGRERERERNRVRDAGTSQWRIPTQGSEGSMGSCIRKTLLFPAEQNTDCVTADLICLYL